MKPSKCSSYLRCDPPLHDSPAVLSSSHCAPSLAANTGYITHPPGERDHLQQQQTSQFTAGIVSLGAILSRHRTCSCYFLGDGLDGSGVRGLCGFGGDVGNVRGSKGIHFERRHDLFLYRARKILSSQYLKASAVSLAAVHRPHWCFCAERSTHTNNSLRSTC